MNKIDLRDTRHKNLMRLIDDVFDKSQSEFAAAIKRNPTQVNHWVSRYRNPNGDTCRDVERSIGYQEGWLDQDHDIDPTLPASLPAAPLYTEGSKPPLALTGIAPVAINDVASALVILCQSLGGLDPSRRDAVIGSLTTLVRSPGDALVRDQLAQMLGDSGFADQCRKAA